MQDFDVVVVGAGPTGLLLAAELALGGARPLVLERLDEPDRTIKAGGMGAIAGEALERRGLGPQLDAAEATMLESMNVMRQQLVSAQPALQPRSLAKAGGHWAGIMKIDQSRQREPARRIRGVRQEPLERILLGYAASLGVEIRPRRDRERLRSGRYGGAGARGRVHPHVVAGRV